MQLADVLFKKLPLNNSGPERVLEKCTRGGEEEFCNQSFIHLVFSKLFMYAFQRWDASRVQSAMKLQFFSR